MLILFVLQFLLNQYLFKYNGPNHLLLAMLQTFVWQHCQWRCPQKIFCLKLPNSVRNAKTFLEAMPLAMLPTKSLQHCQDQMIWAIKLCHCFTFLDIETIDHSIPWCTIVMFPVFLEMISKLFT